VTSVSRTRPRRRLDAVRRPQILAATIELVREKGLWSVRISDVAKRAGLSPTGVVYYFGTKDQLFAEAITHAD
jgi:AcrR family transcriptional regulator